MKAERGRRTVAPNILRKLKNNATPQEQKLTSHELEILTVVKALKKFRVYLLSTQFKIVTLCRAFLQTMIKKDTCLWVARWAILIGEFKG